MRKVNNSNSFVPFGKLAFCAEVGLLIVLSATPSLALSAGSSLTFCNQSSVTTLRVALVEARSMSAVLGVGYPWQGVGWMVVHPNRCRTIFEDAPWQNSFWLRIEADGRPLRTEWSNHYITPVEDKFCFNPKEKYSWQRMKKSEASKDCTYGTHSGLFNFFLKFNEPTEARVGINPDDMDRYPAEKFGLTTSEREVKQRITSLIPADIAGEERRPAFIQAVQVANSQDARLLECTYFNKQMKFWYEKPPHNLHDFIRIDRETGGVLAKFGTEGLRSCPADEAAADRILASNQEKWGRATALLPR